jgi:hypothetical protein|nr:MAG TPA: hypothetical protein [Caudoviricetes sp.]
MPFNVASALCSLALTASVYGAGPLLLRLRKGPISSKALKWLHIGYTAILAFAFSIYDFSNGYDISFSPALLWGSIFYWWNRSYFDKKRRSSVPFSDPKHEEAASTNPVQPEPTPVLQEAPPELAVELPPAVVEQPPAVPKKPEKPKRKPRVLTIIFCIALALSLAGNVWQGVMRNAERKEFDSELKRKDQAFSNLKRANISLESEISDLKEYHFDTYYTTGYIVSGSNYYHKYDCPVFKAANTYQSHNTKFCEWLGYSACPVCKSGFLINFNSKMPQQSAP